MSRGSFYIMMLISASVFLNALHGCRTLRFCCTKRTTTGYLLLSSGQRITLLLYNMKIAFIRVYYCNVISLSADIHLQFSEIYTSSLGEEKIQVSCIFPSSLAPTFLIFPPTSLFAGDFTNSQIASLFSTPKHTQTKPLSPVRELHGSASFCLSPGKTCFDGLVASKAQQLLVGVI